MFEIFGLFSFDKGGEKRNFNSLGDFRADLHTGGVFRESQNLEFSVYSLIKCLQSTTGIFSCNHSQNNLPIDFEVF